MKVAVDAVIIELVSEQRSLLFREITGTFVFS
jgi:hypothetical protein